MTDRGYGDRSELSGDRDAPSGGRLALSGGRLALSGDRDAPSGGRLALSGGRLALSGDRFTQPGPSDAASTPIVELVAPTRHAEARTAMATVAGLRDRGVATRDVTVVARDLDTYEDVLSSAAGQFGLTPVFWTQLRLTNTRPYALVAAVCTVFAERTLDRETLLRPLEHCWVPPAWSRSAAEDTDRPTWPMDQRALLSAHSQVPAAPRPINEWVETLCAESGIDPRIIEYAEWVDAVPDPTPQAVRNVLGDVCGAYESSVLPTTKRRDSPALQETETDARAVVRTSRLIEQVAAKYADRLTDDTFAIDPSWRTVASLIEAVATQLPGRREHSNAHAIDIREANDIWALDPPYVVAVGLLDGEWPQRSSGVLPPELQEAILTGSGDASTLAPRTTWVDGRERSHFEDTVAAAGNGLIATRHLETVDGEQPHRSPLLEERSIEQIGETQRRRLVSIRRTLPKPIAAMIPDGDARESVETSSPTEDAQGMGDRTTTEPRRGGADEH